MFAGMAAKGLPKGWGNALLVGRLDVGGGPLPVIVENGRVREVSRSTPTVSEFSTRGLARLSVRWKTK